MHGYEITGGGTPVSPAPMWANFMAQAMIIGNYEIEYFEDGIESGTIISAPPPKPTKKPKPTESPDPSPSEEPSPDPTEPEPLPSESPTPEPSLLPRGNAGNNRRRGRAKPGGGEP